MYIYTFCSFLPTKTKDCHLPISLYSQDPKPPKIINSTTQINPFLHKITFFLKKMHKLFANSKTFLYLCDVFCGQRSETLRNKA